MYADQETARTLIARLSEHETLKELTNPGNFAARKPPFSRQIRALADKDATIHTTGGL
jgi:hypothetical protein